jgi:hypothetical protein
VHSCSLAEKEDEQLPAARNKSKLTGTLSTGTEEMRRRRCPNPWGVERNRAELTAEAEIKHETTKDREQARAMKNQAVK